MEEIKVKKERKFLKVLGDIALTLFRELLLNMGKKVINKVGNKRQNLVIAFLMVAGISYASIDSIPYPITTNKQKLGWQTTGNGLVYRGRASDTITKPSNYTNKDIKAYLLVDTVNNVMYSYIASKGGWQFNNSDTVIIQGATMPFDSITFNTAKDGTVGVGEVEYNDTQGSLIQGLKGGNVTNVIGQQLHQRVNNRTGATLNKGDVVYLSGSQGNRITVAKALATSDPTSANTFGIVAESIADNQSGYIITEGLITGLNTSSLTQDSAVYLSGTTAGALTSTKPQAPIHSVYIGVCVKTNAGSGEVFVKIRNGQELDELHDVQISSPINNASLYFKSNEGLWRDTTAALLVSDTASMLTPYLRKLDTVSLSNRINLKLNISDTASMLTPYFKDADTTSLNLTSRFATKLNISDTASMLTNYLRSGVAASTYQAKLNGIGLVYANGTNISYDNSTYLTTSTAASTYQIILTNPVTGTGTNNYIPKFTSTGSTIGNSTLIDNGSTISTSSIFSTTNYGLFNTTQVMGNTSGMLSTHRFTSANANGVYNKDFFLTSYMGAPWQGSDVGSGNRSKPPIVAIVNNNDPSFINSGLHLMTTNSTNNTYTPAITFGVNSENGSYYNTIGAIVGKKLNTGQFTSLSTGQLEFFGTGTTLDATGASMTTANMTLGVGVGIGYTTAPTVKGRLTVLEKLGINQSTPNFALDVSGTANITGATTLGSTLAVTGNITEGGNNVLTNLDTASLSSRIDLKLNKTDTASLSNRINTKFNSSGGTISGAVTLSTTTAVPTVLLGKDGSNVVGELNIGGGLVTVGSNLISIRPFYAADNVTSIIYASGFMNTVSTVYQKITQNSTVTITLPSAVGYAGRSFVVKNLGTGAVISNASNVEPFNSSSLGPNILPSGGGKWARLVSDGTNWVIMEAN